MVLDESETGITITIADVSVWTGHAVNVFVTPRIPLDSVYVHRLRSKARHRRASTVQKINRFLLWLGGRWDGECRQTVLCAEALAKGLVSTRKQFERLIEYAVEDGYLVRYRSRVSLTGGPSTYLLDWTVLGEGVYHGQAHCRPRPTFYRQAIGRHKSASQVFLALGTRDWLLRTGYVATRDDIWLFPTRRQIESGVHEGETFLYDPDIVVVRPDSSCQVIELEVFSFKPTREWYKKWQELGSVRDTIGIVTSSARKMEAIITAIARWRKREPDAPLYTRFLFTNLQTLHQRSSPETADPLPPGTFWLAELAPVATW